MVKTFNQMYIGFLQNEKDCERVVLRFNEQKVTIKEFAARVEEIMKHLIKLGVREGTGVGYSLVNHIDILPLFIAVSRLGGYTFPLFTGFPAKYKMTSYQMAQVSVVITNQVQAKELEEAGEELGYKPKIAVIEEDTEFPSIFGKAEEEIDVAWYMADPLKEDIPLLIGLSSGTTGIPKMVAMSQKNIGSEVIVMMGMQDITSDKMGVKNENLGKMVAFPFSTSVMLVILGMLFSKQIICFTDDMSPDNFLKMAEKTESSCITCPPAYFESLLLLKDTGSYDLSKIQGIEGGMDFISASLIRRMKEFLPNLKTYGGGYGLVETCNVYMIKILDVNKEDVEDTAKYELVDLADNVIKVLDEEGNPVADGEIGEIYVKGPNVVAGYMETPVKVKERFPDGWLKTGDIAMKINDKTVNLLGREKFFIKRGGKSISPIMVQAEINKTPGVKDAAVVGVPHPLFGEMIWAFVVKKDNADVSIKEIKQTCKKELPYYMLPDQITFIDEIPKKSGVGKVDFETIRKMGAEQLNKILSGK
ncbi:class I adenylate-forming enzyme family protein [[Clostridium] polysaccharolyticum]|uniref:Acyl-CoA synthetase (AMP-forming)/AMP-acid ligase II n=1 Tax=[Clostridium] polysaccharolyticum TaxID=29364 RepID=A0A1I0A915_9FIRM|nr:class I adenylate-forming enzyme family protein [[Clostridium] polysaccharolyticum]SES90496.1 Acyl-CoA synthetase (AMP-forming)/AMP-acid ligase II [[Clostridium] polysaccharolyticum]